MKRLILAVALFGAPAFANEMIARGDAALGANRLEEAIAAYQDASTAEEPNVRAKGEFKLAQALAQRGMPVAAFNSYARIVQEGKAHPFYFEAVAGLVEVQQQIDDQDLVANVLAKGYDPEWEKLDGNAVARLKYMVGTIAARRGEFENARTLLEAVPPSSAVYAKARYLLGVVLADPRFPNGAQNEAAVAAFQTVVDLADRSQVDAERTRQLALLGLARTYYAMGNFPRAAETYDRVPRFSEFWDQALFENGFARFQNDDYGGALGTLQALHAPQFAGAFQPESWILKSTVYYFSCLFDESNAALRAFEQVYLPVEKQLQPLAEGDVAPEEFYRMVADPKNKTIPKPVLVWTRSNEHMQSVLKLIQRVDVEKNLALTTPQWRGKVGSEIANDLVTTRDALTKVAGQLAKNRVTEAFRNIREFSNQAEIIRFETAKAQKEFYEDSVDQKQVLSKQVLHRPGMPGEDWNYWSFDGEFWIDEIGYYQYTLKKGCPAPKQEQRAEGEAEPEGAEAPATEKAGP